MTLASGGVLYDIRLLSHSPQAIEANFSGNTFYLRQSIKRANGLNTVQMSLEAKLINISETTLVFYGERGCIGGTTVDFLNSIHEPYIVKTMKWYNYCTNDRKNLHKFEVPIDLFTK